MFRSTLIIIIMCMVYSANSQTFEKLISKKYVSGLIKKRTENDREIFEAKFNSPIIEMKKGNSHISDIRFTDLAIDIILTWDVSAEGRYQYAKVPWSDIFSGIVKYGLAEFYSESGSQIHFKSKPFDSIENGGVSDEIAHKIFPDKKISLYKNKIIIHSGITAEIQVPKKNTIISFDATSDYIFLVIDSDQGYHDGELGLPFLTTQIFIVPMP